MSGAALLCLLPAAKMPEELVFSLLVGGHSLFPGYMPTVPMRTPTVFPSVPNLPFPSPETDLPSFPDLPSPWSTSIPSSPGLPSPSSEASFSADTNEFSEEEESSLLPSPASPTPMNRWWLDGEEETEEEETEEEETEEEEEDEDEDDPVKSDQENDDDEGRARDGQV